MARPIVMPSLGMYTAEGTLVDWLRPAGSTVRAGEPIVEVSTEKASHELVAPEDGILHPVAVPGTNLSVEALIGYILGEGEDPPTPDCLESHTGPGSRSQANSTPILAGVPEVRATPVARRLAKEHQIDLASLKGTGPGGRIVEADILSSIQHRGNSEATSTASGSREPRVLKRSPLTPMRRTISERLKRSMSAAVSLTLTREVRADVLVRSRTALTTAVRRKLSWDALFIKLLGLALRDHPELNATVEDDAVLSWQDINIGFAVAVPGGLQVPVVHNADTKTLVAITSAVMELGRRAVDSSLQPEEVLGGTATITNLGGFGVDAFTPVLNPPQSVILGIGRILERPVVERGVIVPAKTCVLSLTFDHRVADGVPAAQLLERLSAMMMDEEFLLALN